MDRKWRWREQKVPKRVLQQAAMIRVRVAVAESTRNAAWAGDPVQFYRNVPEYPPALLGG